VTMKLLLLGSTGLLGSTLGPYLRSCEYEVLTHSRSERSQFQVDLDDTIKTYEMLDRISPDSIINLAALTDVDLCEIEPNKAFLANVRTIENISNWINQRRSSCHLVHISTDQVYDSVCLHTEDSVKLTNYYGFSKYAGELAASSIPSTILRTNFFGRSRCSNRSSLTDWLYRSLTRSDFIEVFDDVMFSPLSMSTVSEMIELSVRYRPVGVFNLGSHNGMSKSDLAFSFADKVGLSTNTMKRTKTNQVSFLKAYRPKDMRMDSDKIERILGIKLPSLIDEIEQAAEDYYEIK